MASRDRGTVLKESMQIFQILADGCSHTINSFLHLKMKEKTIRRHLAAITNDPFFKTQRLTYQPGFTRWKSTFFKLPFQTPKLKECTKCHKVSFNPKEDFHKDRNSIDGLYIQCKVCWRKWTNGYHSRPEVKERMKAKARRRYRLQKRAHIIL